MASESRPSDAGVTVTANTKPHASARTEKMAVIEKGLNQKADVALDDAKTAIATLKSEGTQASAATIEAGTDALEALQQSLSAAGHALKGTALAAGGVAVRMAEELGDLLGAAMQQVGRGLLAVGNFLRGISGGAQVTTETVAGSKGESLSDRLFAKSTAEFERASNATLAALDALVDSGAHLGQAAGHLLATAEASLEVAAALGDAAVLTSAEAAVATARVAVDLAERGVDGAGAALQRAGIAIIGAGNAVNTARGSDTAVLAAG